MATKEYVYFFGNGKAEGHGDMKDLLGGKGAGLAEMTNLGVPVPAGFTKAGLPVGAMLSARPFDEPRLLALAYAYQQVTKHNRARPPLKA